MPFSNDFVPVNFINKSVTPTGTPDIDATWLNYFQSEVGQIGDGLATYSSDLETLQAIVTALGTPFTDPGHISGLKVEYISATSIRITSGGCYIPATGTIVSKSTDTTTNLSGLASNTLYYLYASNVSGSVVFDPPSTTAPVLYYAGAKHKSGDSSRRYVGEFRTQAASTNAIPFRVMGNLVVYQPRVNGWFGAPFFLGSKANATVGTLNLSGLVPVGCKIAMISGANYASEVCYFGDPAVLTNSVYEQYLEHGGGDTFNFPIALNDSLQTGVRLNATSGNSAQFGCVAYYRER